MANPGEIILWGGLFVGLAGQVALLSRRARQAVARQPYPLLGIAFACVIGTDFGILFGTESAPSAVYLALTIWCAVTATLAISYFLWLRVSR